MPLFSVNLEYLYAERGSFEERLRAAAADGFKFVEMFSMSDKDIPALRTLAKSLDVGFACVVAEPRCNFTTPGADLDAFYAGLRVSLEKTVELGCPRLNVTTGLGFPAVKRQVQLDRLVVEFGRIADVASGYGVDIVIEPVNSRVDHPGVLIDNTADGAYVVQQVGKPNLRLQFDVYHSLASGEDPFELLPKYQEIAGYIQIADAPGRGEPGTGAVDWPAMLDAIAATGYSQPIGLECDPTTDSSAALQYIRRFQAA